MLEKNKSQLPTLSFERYGGDFTLFLLAKPPFQVFFLRLLALFAVRFKPWSQLLSELNHLLMSHREPAAFAHIAFCHGDIVHLAATFRAIPHFFFFFLEITGEFEEK